MTIMQQDFFPNFAQIRAFIIVCLFGTLGASGCATYGVQRELQPFASLPEHRNAAFDDEFLRAVYGLQKDGHVVMSSGPYAVIRHLDCFWFAPVRSGAVNADRAINLGCSPEVATESFVQYSNTIKQQKYAAEQQLAAALIAGHYVNSTAQSHSVGTAQPNIPASAYIGLTPDQIAQLKNTSSSGSAYGSTAYRAMPRSTAAASSSESRVNGEFSGWDGETVIKLVNGQVWEQSQIYTFYTYKHMPRTVIVNTGGGYKMYVDGVPKAVGVRRLR